ncbi:hypothetical protein KC325_g203 [Hortaea werneckii]|nr:hypothetical protein KC325_g203 [Hortaea werneckii]
MDFRLDDSLEPIPYCVVRANSSEAKTIGLSGLLGSVKQNTSARPSDASRKCGANVPAGRSSRTSMSNALLALSSSFWFTLGCASSSGVEIVNEKRNALRTMDIEVSSKSEQELGIFKDLSEMLVAKQLLGAPLHGIHARGRTFLSRRDQVKRPRVVLADWFKLLRIAVVGPLALKRRQRIRCRPGVDLHWAFPETST